MDRKSCRNNRTRATRHGKKLVRLRNRYQIEQGETPSKRAKLSASSRKIQKDTDYDVNITISYRILNFFTVFTALSNYLSCKKCGGDIIFCERSVRGLGFKLVVNCNTCDSVSIDSCPLIDNAYEINRRFVFAMRLLGVGLNGAEKFCAFMDLPRPIFHSFYDRVVKMIKDAAKTVCDTVLAKAAQEEIQKTAEAFDTDEIPGITVSGDGSWKKRGFKSLYGIASLIGFYSGKIVDVIMKNSFCKACAQMVSKKDTPDYETFMESHAENCPITHTESSGKMESDGIREMFERSESLHNVKYVNYIGDGDTKTYKNIVDAKPYGDVCITKKECINHVQKRMGSRLRALKKKEKTEKTPVGAPRKKV